MNYVSLFLLSFILMFCYNIPAKSQEKDKTLIGIIESDSTHLTVDKKRMISVYNSNLLKFSNINANFTDVKIITTTDKGYLLVFTGEIYKSSFIVTEKDAKLYAINNISCTTTECSSEEIGCSPKPSELGCWPCKNEGKCTKTVSSISLIE